MHRLFQEGETMRSLLLFHQTFAADWIFNGGGGGGGAAQGDAKRVGSKSILFC